MRSFRMDDTRGGGTWWEVTGNRTAELLHFERLGLDQEGEER